MQYYFIRYFGKDRNISTLRKQQDEIKKMVKYMNVHHYSYLKLSVMAMGMVNTKRDNAVDQVKGYRGQVKKIKENLTIHAGIINPNNGVYRAVGVIGAMMVQTTTTTMELQQKSYN